MAVKKAHKRKKSEQLELENQANLQKQETMAHMEAERVRAAS